MDEVLKLLKNMKINFSGQQKDLSSILKQTAQDLINISDKIKSNYDIATDLKVLKVLLDNINYINDSIKKIRIDTTSKDAILRVLGIIGSVLKIRYNSILYYNNLKPLFSNHKKPELESVAAILDVTSNILIRFDSNANMNIVNADLSKTINDVVTRLQTDENNNLTNNLNLINEVSNLNLWQLGNFKKLLINCWKLSLSDEEKNNVLEALKKIKPMAISKEKEIFNLNYYTIWKNYSSWMWHNAQNAVEKIMSIFINHEQKETPNLDAAKRSNEKFSWLMYELNNRLIHEYAKLLESRLLDGLPIDNLKKIIDPQPQQKPNVQQRLPKTTPILPAEPNNNYKYLLYGFTIVAAVAATAAIVQTKVRNKFCLTG